MSQSFRIFNPTSEPIANNGVVGPGALTAGAVIRRYLDNLEYLLQAGKVTAAHADNYRRSLSASATGRYVGFVELVGERLLAELINLDLTDWLRRNPQWKRPDTRLNNLAAVFACFTWAEEQGVIARSPYTKTRQLQEQRIQRRDASDEEADKVWASASEALRRIIWFVNVAGVRTKEARDLLWDQVLWDQQIILIKIHKTSRMQVEPEPRLVGLDADGWTELRRWYDGRKPGQKHVFLSERRKVWTKNNLCQAFERLSERCGLAEDLTPYCFRHRCGTQAILSGATEREAGDQLGHKQSSSTRRYTHTANKIEHIKAVVDKIGAARKALAAKKKAAKPPVATPLFDQLPPADS